MGIIHVLFNIHRYSTALKYCKETTGDGMRDVWVIGEGFFRGIGGMFDVSLSSAQSTSPKLSWEYEYTYICCSSKIIE